MKSVPAVEKQNILSPAGFQRLVHTVIDIPVSLNDQPQFPLRDRPPCRHILFQKLQSPVFRSPVLDNDLEVLKLLFQYAVYRKQQLIPRVEARCYNGKFHDLCFPFPIFTIISSTVRFFMTTYHVSNTEKILISSAALHNFLSLTFSSIVP